VCQKNVIREWMPRPEEVICWFHHLTVLSLLSEGSTTAGFGGASSTARTASGHANAASSFTMFRSTLMVARLTSSAASRSCGFRSAISTGSHLTKPLRP
jgi:hypothetical protein